MRTRQLEHGDGQRRHSDTAGGDPGRRSLTGGLMRKAAPGPGLEPGAQPAEDIGAVAQGGFAETPGQLPHGARIQRAFGRHDVSAIPAHTGRAASAAAGALGAQAYAADGQIAFGAEPDLHTAAHEAAHVVQQRGGVQLKGDVSQPGDALEQHADAVADRVVRGESAEQLLDDVAPAGGAPAAPRGGQVQRLVAAGLEKTALAEQRVSGRLAGDPPRGPAGALPQFFSGKVEVDVPVRVEPNAEIMGELRSKLDGMGPVAAGSPEDYVVGQWAETNRAADQPAFSYQMGAPGAGKTGRGDVLKTYLASALNPDYPQAPVDDRVDFTRSDARGFEVSFGNTVYAKVAARSVDLVSLPRLDTGPDGVLLASRLDAGVDGFRDILGHELETRALVALVRKHSGNGGSEALNAFYGVLRGKLWEGKGAEAWVRQTIADPRALEVLGALQALQQAGVGQARADLDELVGGVRKVLAAPALPAAAKSALRASLAQHVQMIALEITEPELSGAEKTADTANPSFDLARLLGAERMRERLGPLLTGTADLVKLTAGYHGEGGSPPSHLARQITNDARALGVVALQVVQNDLSAPQSFGNLGLREGKLPEDWHRNVVAAARLGAVEALRQEANAIRSPYVVAHLGAKLGLGQIATFLATSPGAKSAATVATAAQSDADDRIQRDYEQLTDISFKLIGAKKSQRQGEALKYVMDDIRGFSLTEDDKQSRLQLEAVGEGLDRKATLQTLMSHLETKAEIAKTQVILAFETAFDRFKPEFIASVQAFFDGQAEGVLAGPIAKANQALGLLKHVGVEAEISAGGAQAALPAIAAPIAAVAAIAGFVNSWFKAEIAKQARETIAKLEKGLDGSRSALLTKVESAVGAEAALYARGKMRTAAGVEVALTSLATGTPAQLTGSINLETESAEVLTKRLRSAIADTGVPYQAIYNAQYQALRVSAEGLWESYRKALHIARPIF